MHRLVCLLLRLLLYSTTAVIGVAIVGGSWFLSTRVPRADVEIAKGIETPPPAPAPPAAPIPSATPTNVADPILAEEQLTTAVWSPSTSPSSMPRPGKLFAGTWRGNVHSTGPKSTWDSTVELTVDDTETRWSNMIGGSVSRDGRSLIYRRSYKVGKSTTVQVQATLTVHEDDRTASYSTSQLSVTGKSRSKTSGTGTLEKAD